MKTFFSEYVSNYETYSFGYGYYALPKSIEEYSQAYESGFLTYTANLTFQDSVFFMCRSLRVNTTVFENNSENRRILRKVKPYEITAHWHDINDFNTVDEEFIDFCLLYASSRFSHASMSKERLAYILSRQYINRILEFRMNDKPIGYVVCAQTDRSLHYYFCFFDISMMEQIPLGKYFMWYAIDQAKQKSIPYVYLGTGYKSTALYKVRDFNGIEWWDGNQRQTDVERLKQLCMSDEEQKSQDQFKEHPDLYL